MIATGPIPEFILDAIREGRLELLRACGCIGCRDHDAQGVCACERRARPRACRCFCLLPHRVLERREMAALIARAKIQIAAEKKAGKA